MAMIVGSQFDIAMCGKIGKMVGESGREGGERADEDGLD
jgi:hypothetical protein